MNELDRKIREALSEEEAELFDEFGREQSVAEMLIESFQGRHRWINIYGAIWMVVFLVAGVYSAVQMFSVAEVTAMLKWAVGVILCAHIVAMFKVWYWLEIQKNALAREVKRLELQVAHLSRRRKE